MVTKCSCGDPGVMALGGATILFLSEADSEAIEREINHRRGEKREDLAEDEAADDRDSERAPQFETGSGTERERYTGKERRHRGHHDRPETEQARLIDRIGGRLTFVALRIQREIDHHNAVLLHDSDQQDDSDQG